MRCYELQTTLEAVARFCDERRVGDVGSLGFRRSSELARLLPCLEPLVYDGILIPGKTRFLDMGCADGRVNVFLSWLVRRSVGVEMDDWILDDHAELKRELEAELSRRGLPPIPGNIRLFEGDSTDDALHDKIESDTGLRFEDFDLFYTYLTMQEEFAALIARKARSGAVFAVYGLERIQPRLPGFDLLTPVRALNGILALYRKE
ncbi:MAG: hypothetical protein K9M82_00015 [Deltaproteobacteria bacterium]|nr:hypothetical protein [Deltaproteobacteria bacterium]